MVDGVVVRADVRLVTQAVADGGWTAHHAPAPAGSGVRWRVDCDEAVDTQVGACDRRLPLALLADVEAAAVGVDGPTLRVALRPVVEDLLRRGFLDAAEVTC